ncbi:hypothetical protein HG531_012382 [Fusarium graminearum]|nr:hypothetical protein HG531_012382 [Fusarium graminearum]
MLIQDKIKVGPAKVRGIKKTSKRRCRMFICAVHLQKPTVHVSRYLLLFGCYVCVDADVEMRFVFMLAVPVLTHGYIVEKVGQPEEIGKDTRKWRDADTSSDDDGMVEVVEPLSRCTKGTVDANFDLRLSRITSKFTELSSPVAVSLDVQHHLVASTERHSEWMPLEEADFGNLQEDVLASLVLPETFTRDDCRDLDSLFVQYLHGSFDAVESETNTDGAFYKDQKCGKGQEVTEHGPLKQRGCTMSHHETNDGKHE